MDDECFWEGMKFKLILPKLKEIKLDIQGAPFVWYPSCLGQNFRDSKIRVSDDPDSNGRKGA